MKRLALLLALFGGCAGASELDLLGDECMSSNDRHRRLALVKKLMVSGDRECIPILINCLEAMKRHGKGPDRVYEATSIEPNVTVPPEFWALYVLTGQDFDLDIAKWRAWYERVRGWLVWDGGSRRFIVR